MRVIPSPWRRSRRILGALVLSIVCILAFFVVLVPFLLGAQSYTVLTGSMRPALEPGHLIAVRDAPIEEIAAGDIITFQIESGKPEVATHRVVGVGHSAEGERLLITQGDANNIADADPVQEAQLRGVLVYAIPWLGYINVWATPAVKSVVVTVVGIGAISWGIFILFKDTRRRRRLTQAAAVAAAAVMLITFSPNVPAAQAADQDALLLSADGITWTSGSDLSILDASDRIVPGQDLALSLWVRNASGDPAEFTVTGAWTPSDPASARDIALAEGLTIPTVNTQSLTDGDSLRVPLTVGLDESADNTTRVASATLTMTVTLTQAGADEDNEGPLALTGSDVPVLLIVVASVLVGAGILLIAKRLIARRRNRHDP